MTGLDLYVIYDHPKDYPTGFVVRPWYNGHPYRIGFLADTLEAARKLVPHGMHRLPRYEQDDPCIVEVWI